MSFNSKWSKVASGDILGRILIEKNLSTTTVWPVSHSRAIEKGRGWEVLLNISCIPWKDYDSNKLWSYGMRIVFPQMSIKIYEDFMCSKIFYLTFFLKCPVKCTKILPRQMLKYFVLSICISLYTHGIFINYNRIWLLHFTRNGQMRFDTPFSTKNKIKIKPTKRQKTSWDLSLMKSWIVRIFFSVIF